MERTLATLKATTVTRFEVDCYDFDDFVKEIYGQEYEFVPDIECGNDSQHSFTAKKSVLNKWDLEKLNKFSKTGEYSYLAHALFTDLVNRDILPEGDYLIRVSW
jgi:hypothetical protein